MCTFLNLVSQSSASPRLELIILLSTVKGNSSPNLPPCPAWWSKKQIKDVSLNQVGGPGDNWGKASWKFTSALSASITDDDDDRLLLERNIHHHRTCINFPDLYVGWTCILMRFFNFRVCAWHLPGDPQENSHRGKLLLPKNLWHFFYRAISTTKTFAFQSWKSESMQLKSEQFWLM